MFTPRGSPPGAVWEGSCIKHPQAIASPAHYARGVSAPPEPGVALAVRGVSKTFRLPHEQVHTLKERALHPFRTRSEEKLEALRDVSIDVRSGEFFGIVGRNGS